MSNRPKRRLEDFDPNASDPDDSDFEVDHSRPQKRSRKSAATPSARRSRPQKRRRGEYDSDDIVDDEDDLELDDSFSENSKSEDEEPEINERTGRAVRKSAKKEVKYEEESDEEIEDPSGSSDSDELARSTKPKARNRNTNTQRNSLIVVLKLPRNTIEGTGRRTRGAKGPTSSRPNTAGSDRMVSTRRSSRLSHDVEEPTMSLSASGKHVIVNRLGTTSPEAQELPRRGTRGGKGLKKPPSAIIEASFEDSQPQPQDDPTDVDEDATADEPEAVLEEAEAGGSATQPDEDFDILKTDLPAQEVQESANEDDKGATAEEEEEDDEGPVTRRSLRTRNTTEGDKSSQKSRRRAVDESSDFDPAGDGNKEDENDEDMSASEPTRSKRRQKSSSQESGARRTRHSLRKSQRSQQNSGSEDSELDREELLDEAEELAQDKARNRRSTRGRRQPGITYDHQPALRNRGNKVDYRVFRPELAETFEEEENAPAATPSRNRGRGGGSTGWRTLFSTQGPFGGTSRALFGGPEGTGAAGGIDSDSSDDDQPQGMARPSVGGAVGMTPTSAMRPNLHNTDPLAKSGGPANLGKVENRKALADADPLGVDTSVSFEGVGGLDGHIDQLKEMVMLPLLYPELFKNFNVTPPRGVLFHGPPGTGKTLLARALASSVSTGGQKVTFYMRKGADALSKWVGEAERQLRLLFEEARKNQPSIIFFDEIDGLAPVRSSKQEQIHASIVATLLALMDGMDGRGQVIVIGATNRPDSVDPALRRPGRFDREFYFPLPTPKARRAIIDIHTKGWEPPLGDHFKDQLADLTKGYGGADLRALCTEAALNAIQGTYPQIYKSTKKYIVDPNAIKVLAKDFMISVNKMIPSSERSAHSSAAPLPKKIEPLLRQPFAEITSLVDSILPRKRKLTALEEAEFDDRDDANGFEREMMETEFQQARVFRPRLLVRGLGGMGQQYIASALLNKLEGVFVQSFDLATLLEDSSRSPEAAVVQLFKEVRRHKPSVIYIPNVDVWYDTVPPQAIRMFKALVRSLRPDESVLLVGMIEDDEPIQDPRQDPHHEVIRDLFGYTLKSQYVLARPSDPARHEFFSDVINYIALPPSRFPDPKDRKRRKLAQLELAPEKPPPEPTKEELKAQKKADRMTLNKLKQFVQPVMDQIRMKYKQFRMPIIDEARIRYLYEEQDPNTMTTDLPPELQEQQGVHRPFEMATDKYGAPCLREVETGRLFYNVDTVMIEKRLSNGYYKRPKDYYDDIKRLAKDWSQSGNDDKAIKANELLTNVEVDMAQIEQANPALMAECDAVYEREKARAKKAQRDAQAAHQPPSQYAVIPPETSNTTGGAIILGPVMPGRNANLLGPTTPMRPSHATHSNGDSSVAGNASNLSNGVGLHDEDVEMTDNPESNDHTKITPGNANTQSGPNTQGHVSQLSAHTQLERGFDPHDLQNSASTTTSGQKTDRSNRFSGSNSNNTQSTNGVPGGAHHPDFERMAPPSLASQIPDTQGTSSFESHTSYDSSTSKLTANSDAEFPTYGSQNTGSQASQSSQGPVGFAGPLGAGPLGAGPMPPPPNPAAPAQVARQPTSINAILNSETSPQLVMDRKQLDKLHQSLTQKSSGLSLEQLEQVNAYLMDTVWTHRHDWNRSNVTNLVIASFNEIVNDIEMIQTVQPPSQRTQDGRN